MDGIYFKCSEQEACDLKKAGKPHKIYFDFDNWTMRYDLICENAAYRSHSKTGLLITSTLTCLVLLMYADILGRRTLMRISSFLVICGILLTGLFPSFLVKMIGLGLVGGAEGAFSALFTIYINENTIKTTKLRSSLISISFLAYSIGCILFNCFAYITTNPFILCGACAVTIICSVIPSSLFFHETPYFLYKKGRITELFDVLMSIYRYNQGKHGCDETLYIAVENKIIQLMGIDTHITTKAWFKSNVFRLYRKRTKDAPSANAITRLCTSSKHMYYLTTLVFIGGLIYMLFYGMSINIQELGLKDIKMNGMLLGATQAIGNLAVVPFIHKMPRKRWMILFQIAILIGAVVLSALSRETQTSMVQFEQTVTSTLWMATIMSAIFPLFFMYTTECFPTEVRGTANAIILFSAKMIGSMSPMLENFSVSHKIHVVAGCSAFVILSLPLTFGMKETLLPVTD